MRLVHRLLHQLYGIPANLVLNAGPLATGAVGSPAVAADLYRLVNALKEEVFDVERGRVDYARVRTSAVYAEYQACARQLPVIDLAALTRREEQLAFWINVYNALIVDAVIQFAVKRSINDVRGFFWRAAYSIGGLRFNAYDIEFGILRANAPHPAIPGPHFTANDPRRRFSLTQRDPRVHFALNCASRSCPPINFYAPDQIDQQLDRATRSFINGGGVEIDREQGEVRLSKILQWYAPDFGASWLVIGQRQPLLNFVTNYLANEKDRAVVERGHPRVQFLRYDWSLNQAV